MSLDLIVQTNITFLVSYLVLASIVVLVQHYASTFNDERKYIWNAPPSFAKYCYLLSRHLPILVTAVIFVLLSGLRGYTVVDEICGWTYCVAAVCLVASFMINNALATLYIVSLWQQNRFISRAVIFAFAAAYSTGLAALFVALARMKDGMVWSPLLNMCIVTRVDPLLIVTSATTIAFELSMLVLVCLNALDRPRVEAVPLRHVLVGDGVVFFLLTTVFRAIQLGLVSTLEPPLSMLGLLSLSLSCMVSIVFNQRAFVRQGKDADEPQPRDTHTPLPKLELGHVLPRKRTHGIDSAQWPPGAEVTLGRVDVELHKDSN